MRAFLSMFSMCALIGLALPGCGGGDGPSPQSSADNIGALTDSGKQPWTA